MEPDFDTQLSAEEPLAAPLRVWNDTVRWVLLGAFVVLLAVASARGAGWVPLVSHVDLGIHEFGHMIAMWAPRQFMALAGSLLQVAAPLGLAAFFWFVRKELPAAALLVAWAGVSIRNVSVYMADANTRVLPLLGGQEGHDWAYLFGQWGALPQAERIAGFFSVTGWLAFGFAFALAVWGFARPRLQAHSRVQYEAHLETLPVREPRNRPPAPTQ